MKRKLKVHLIQLPRWFALPFFGSAVLLGSVMAGGINLNAWLAFLVVILVMAGGHSLNSYLDYAWTKLDQGEVENRSAEKAYTGGQNLIETKVVSLREVFWNGLFWYALSAIPMAFLLTNGASRLLILPWAAGLFMTIWYSWSKFNYTHELSLGFACGVFPMLIGALAVNPDPNYGNLILASIPFMIVLSFGGLALDEWEDAEPNLKKGVKSLAFEVWKYSETLIGGDDLPVLFKSLDTLRWYLSMWFLFMFFFQGLLINLGILKPLTALCLLMVPFIIACMLLLKSNFKKWAAILVMVGAVYEILILVGQIWG